MFKHVKLNDAILKFYQRSQPIAFSNAETLYDDLVLLRDQILMYGDLSEAQTNYLNNFIEKFDTTLTITVRDIFEKWLNDGFLVDLIRELINEEVVESRDGETRLNIRLNRDKQAINNEITQLKEKDNELTAQLAQKAYKYYIDVKKDWGATGDGVKDDTEDINNAMMSADSGETVYIPDGVYLVNPEIGINVINKKNLKIEFAPNATLKAIGNDKNSYHILRINKCENVHISGGHILGERYEHIGTSGEWGHGLSILHSHRILVEDMFISDCWGDGVYIVHGESEGQECTDISLNNVHSSNNRRQGMSVVGCIGLVATNCSFNNTNGTAPQAGVDIEPNTGFIARDITLSNCTMNGNVGNGFLNGGTGGLDIKLIACNITNNTDHGIYLAKGNGIIADSLIKDNQRHGIYINNGTKYTLKGNIVVGSKESGIHLLNNNAVEDFTCVIVGNDVSLNTINGVYLRTSKNVTLSNNIIYLNGLDGVQLSTECDNTLIQGNIVNKNGGNGLLVQGKDTLITDNVVYLNGRNGILTGAASIAVIGNRVSANNQSNGGYSNIIQTAGSFYGAFTNNFCRSGTQTIKPVNGIKIEAGNSAFISNNDCFQGGEVAGISADVAITNGGNRNLDGSFSTTAQ